MWFCAPAEVSLFVQTQISDKVLLRILRHPDVIQEIKFNESDKRSLHHYIYQKGKPVDYFILILQVNLDYIWISVVVLKGTKLLVPNGFAYICLIGDSVG